MLFQLSAQELLTVEFVDHSTQQSIANQLGFFGIQVEPTSGVDAYKITYTTRGSDMLPDTASGLMLLPDNITGSLPMVCYQHGTTNGRSDVPSNLDGGYELGLIFASVGMVVAAPDYLGMGDSRGFHPYVHAATEASAAVDMLYAVWQYLEENDLERDDEFFITGYSQGGHATMAVHKLIQEQYSTDFPVTASLPMSGPYDVSGVMRDLALQDEEYFYPSFLVYATLGAKAILPDIYNDISEVFKSEFLEVIRPFEATGEGLGAMNLQILEILENQFGASVPKFIFRDSFLTAFETNPDHPLNQYMKSNDLYNWVPNVPVRMLYCPTDDQVPYLNSIVADSVMNANGAEDVEAVDVSGGIMHSHTTCILPAINDGIPWLLNFLDGPISATVEINGESFEVGIFPNPAIDFFQVDPGSLKVDRLEMFSLDGKRLLLSGPFDGPATFDVPDNSSGIHILRLWIEGHYVTEKIVFGR